MMFFWLIFGISLALSGLVLWNVAAWPRLARATACQAATVSVLLPARNEEDNLAECLESVLAQGFAVTEILIYDDHSDDATPRLSYAPVDTSLMKPVLRDYSKAPDYAPSSAKI
jgi:cellulose synthase/poly-beta-1,6-N-acetylglucosamine synthase-like glycosyltransferase